MVEMDTKEYFEMRRRDAMHNTYERGMYGVGTDKKERRENETGSIKELALGQGAGERCRREKTVSSAVC